MTGRVLATAASQARKRGPRDVSPDALLEHLQAAYSKERNWLTQSQKNATYKYTMDFFDKIKGPHDLLINQHYYFDDVRPSLLQIYYWPPWDLIKRRVIFVILCARSRRALQRPPPTHTHTHSPI